MIELLETLGQDVTLLLIEHDMDVALRVASRVVVMADGLMIATGTPDEIRGSAIVRDTVMGLVQAPSGQIVFKGERIENQTPEKIARHGISYVPQGRGLFPSLAVDEHLTMLAKGTGDKRWTIDGVYELFPRLAERCRNGGGQLSGGEQQMLAVGRALLLNGSLVIMDEPSEGLAPTIVDTLIEVVHRLVGEGVAVLVVEQNLRAAVRMANRQLVMVSGRIQAETSAAELIANPELQQRYLGLEGVGTLNKEMS